MKVEHFGASVWAMVLVMSAVLASCTPSFDDADCYRGMGLGQTVEVELVEPYERLGRYRYWDMGLVPVPCEGADGLAPGQTLRFRLVERGNVTDCNTYGGQLEESLPGVVPVTQPRGGTGVVLAAQNRFEGDGCAPSFWRFFVMRRRELDDNPFDEAADGGGGWPPVVVQREINGCCLEQWVGAVRHVESIDSGLAGSDAR